MRKTMITDLHCCSHLSNIITDVLLSGTLEGYFGADNAHKDPDLVLCLVNFVTVPTSRSKQIKVLVASFSWETHWQSRYYQPLRSLNIPATLERSSIEDLLYPLHGSPSYDITSLFKKQRNPICKSENIHTLPNKQDTSTQFSSKELILGKRKSTTQVLLHCRFLWIKIDHDITVQSRLHFTWQPYKAGRITVWREQTYRLHIFSTQAHSSLNNKWVALENLGTIRG